MSVERDWFERDLTERFIRYVAIHTTSDPHGEITPSTERQLDLARLLAAELTELGVADVEITDNCYVIGTLPGGGGEPFGLIAHLDTSPDSSGENVKPQIHRDYDGGVIKLDSDHRIDPADSPELAEYVGQTIITTDGTTLLGADDKAGVAEIMTAIRFLAQHPELPHPPIEVIFTPDEEIGHGMALVPLDKLRSKYCYTIDGTDEGAIEAECFTAYKAEVTFTGRVVHPGHARGKLANAASMAAAFVAALPRTESPEATDGRFGFYCVTEIRGTMGEGFVSLIVRDFDPAEVERRIEYLDSLASAIERAFPGGSVKVKSELQYQNMRSVLEQHPDVLERLEAAIRATGIEPKMQIIRGGTDGARLTEMGIPTPNMFAGGHNLHGPHEWIALAAMVRAAKAIVNLALLGSSP